MKTTTHPRSKALSYLAALAFLLACTPLALPLTHTRALAAPAQESLTIPFNQGWLFGGKAKPGDTAPDLNDQNPTPAKKGKNKKNAEPAPNRFKPITLPHIVANLSWQNWDYRLWEDIWIYRKHFTIPENMRGMRIFVDFEAVMTGVQPTINGQTLDKHLGGFLPVRYELTKHLAPGNGNNVLAVEVDGRWSNVPPQGSPKGTAQVDYLMPAGIHRKATLVSVPQIYIENIFAKPVNVLTPATRAVEVLANLDAAATGKGKITTELRDGARTIARAEQPITATKGAKTQGKLTLSNLGAITLWSPDTPKLYEVITTLAIDGQPPHTIKTRIGFREIKFTTEGFFLNGQRLRLFGLNRHELFPYVGFAMPSRVMRRDAEILKNTLNLNFVRCSHYPQSDAFLDACDELGLLVWQEVPGWQFVGNADWQELLVRDARDMILRDRNRPSIAIWGTRVNESDNHLQLYRRTRALAKELDGTRPTSGSMHPPSLKDWQTKWEEDIFAYDDYTPHPSGDGTVGLKSPPKGTGKVKTPPYMLAEAVGQFNYKKGRHFDSKYRRAGDVELQMNQALYHAQMHNNSANFPGHCGVVAWCALDYGSIVNNYNIVKCPGVVDLFRVPKLGATFYMAQVSPSVRPVIAPNFYWDFGANTPRGPGKEALIFSNCDRLEIYIDDKPHATLKPDTKNYPNLKHPPFPVNLDLDGRNRPELRIDGYVNNKLVLTRRHSSDPVKDKLHFAPDDTELVGNGSDATRLVLRVTDAYGNERAFASGIIDFEVTGPATIVGDNPLSLAEGGGVGAVWLRSKPDSSGKVTVTAKNRRFGTQTITVTVKKQD